MISNVVLLIFSILNYIKLSNCITCEYVSITSNSKSDNKTIVAYCIVQCCPNVSSLKPELCCDYVYFTKVALISSISILLFCIFLCVVMSIVSVFTFKKPISSRIAVSSVYPSDSLDTLSETTESTHDSPPLYGDLFRYKTTITNETADATEQTNNAYPPTYNEILRRTSN